jgi:fumarylacetoacetate (FAA) hydrolase
MKLATLKRGGRDGTLVVVSKDLTHAVTVTDLSPTLQHALDTWDTTAPKLEKVYADLNAGKAHGAFTLNMADLHSPLPRAYQWLDCSAYVRHVELVRKARGVEMPPHFWTNPLMYQGLSDTFLAPTDPIPFQNPDFGLDLEAEVAVITGDVPMATPAAEAAKYVRLIVLVNDVTLRGLTKDELDKGFGFVQSKPASSFSPIALTPDELGDAWKGGKVHLPIRSFINGTVLGTPNAGVDMTFSFFDLIAHASRTRTLGAGSILGGGTVANITAEGQAGVGSSCLAEVRMLETLHHGAAKTPWLQPGDTVRITMTGPKGEPLFGAIEQTVRKV